MREGNEPQAKTLAWDSLPGEVRAEILLRVPIKSLLQLRCVSQSWNSLITSHNFISAHLKQSKNQPLLLLSYCVLCDTPPHIEETRYSLRLGDGSLPHFACPYLEPPHRDYFRSEPFQIVGSCDGVVCLIDGTGYRVRQLILWNPSIRKYLVLPDGGVLPGHHHPNLRYFLFPESDSYLYLGVGFGFDRRSNDFKVVTIAGLDKNNGDIGGRKCVQAPAKVGVYSCNAGSWRSFEIDFGTLLLCFGSREQFVFNGFVHWLVCRLVDDEDRNFVMWFNLSDESFGEMMLPETLAARRLRAMSIFLYDGCFAVLVRGWKHCELWVMEEYGVEKSWIKRFDFELEGDSNQVAGFGSNGEILLVRDFKSLLSFDPQTHSINEIDTEARCSYFHAVPHVESLYMLDRTKLGRIKSRKRKERPPNVIPEMGKAGASSDGKSGDTSSLG